MGKNNITGFVSGKSAGKPDYLTLEDIKELEINSLSDLARYILETEKAEKAQDVIDKSPHIEELEEENPSEVKDEVEKGSLPQQKDMTTPGAPKLESDKVNYTNLSNYIPTDVKRATETEKPSVSDNFHEECMEEKEVDGDGQSNHTVSLK